MGRTEPAGWQRFPLGTPVRSGIAAGRRGRRGQPGARTHVTHMLPGAGDTSPRPSPSSAARPQIPCPRASQPKMALGGRAGMPGQLPCSRSPPRTLLPQPGHAFPLSLPPPGCSFLPPGSMPSMTTATVPTLSPPRPQGTHRAFSSLCSSRTLLSSSCSRALSLATESKVLRASASSDS